MHLWKSAFQQSCHHMLATMLKKFILWRKFFKVFHESVKYSCCKKHQRRKIWTSKNKPNNSKGASSLCLNYDHSRICFCVCCKSIKRKSWCPRMVSHTHTHEDIFAVNTTRLLFRMWPFLDTVHWKVETIMARYTSLEECIAAHFSTQRISVACPCPGPRSQEECGSSKLWIFFVFTMHPKSDKTFRT